tara:strand:- start:3293 stop:3643 length:351 start_codon:yes stop_codon:yes gene_type:complete
MIIVSKRIIRFFEWLLNSEGIRGLAFYPFIFLTNADDIDDDVLINHERIHLRQQLELGVIPFHIWYLIALYRVGYMQISFEREAYSNEKNLTYLKKRRIFAFKKYLNNGGPDKTKK